MVLNILETFRQLILEFKGSRKIRVNFIVYFCLVLAFWFTLIIMFSKLKEGPMPLIIVSSIAFSFAWAFGWFYFSIILGLISATIINKMKDKEVRIERTLLISNLCSIIFLCFAFLMRSFLGHKYSLSFNPILVFCYAYFILHVFYVLVFWLILTAKSKLKANDYNTKNQ